MALVDKLTTAPQSPKTEQPIDLFTWQTYLICVSFGLGIVIVMSILDVNSSFLYPYLTTSWVSACTLYLVSVIFILALIRFPGVKHGTKSNPN